MKWAQPPCSLLVSGPLPRVQVPRRGHLRFGLLGEKDRIDHGWGADTVTKPAGQVNEREERSTSWRPFRRNNMHSGSRVKLARRVGTSR